MENDEILMYVLPYIKNSSDSKFQRTKILDALQQVLQLHELDC
jgi:hypothetical protein